MTATVEQVEAALAVYKPWTLPGYDFFVLGLSNRWIWKCPTGRILDLYNRNVSADHLEVGVGTGYFLDRCRFPCARPRLALLDANGHCLRFAARRLARFEPETHLANVFEPLSIHRPPFSSVGISYVLHCLPGTIEEKAVVFDNLRPLMADGGVVFGATLLAGGVPRTALARAMMDFYQRKRIFANAQDTLEDLSQVLAARFAASTIDVVGCAALFWAKTPSPAQ